MATIRDVARRAGVSAASVSRVLKNDTTFSVSQKTRERILVAAGELGYNKCFEYSAIQGTKRKFLFRVMWRLSGVTMIRWHPL